MSYNERMTCPYCGNDQCEADWVDNGVCLVQCSPFYCDECTACQIGPFDEPTELTDKEKQTDWYEPGRAYLTCAPTFDGIPVRQEMAIDLYKLGLLDSK